jgi:hypothetical protein
MRSVFGFLDPFVPRPRTLQSRIVVVFAILVVAIQGAVLVLLDAALSSSADVRIRDELVVGERVFRRVLEQNGRQLMQAAEVLSRDFGFREAVATRDVDTLHSVLRNHGARIGVEAMSIVSQDGRILADSVQTDVTGKAFEHAWLLKLASSEGRALGLVVRDEAVHQMVIVPVLAPQPVAWAGCPRDGRSLRERSGKPHRAQGVLPDTLGPGRLEAARFAPWRHPGRDTRRIADASAGARAARTYRRRERRA